MFISKHLKLLEKQFFLKSFPLLKSFGLPHNLLPFQNLQKNVTGNFNLICMFQRSFHERLRAGKYSKELQKIIDEFGSDSLEMANFLETKSIELEGEGHYEDALEMAILAKNIYKDKKMSASEFVLLEVISDVASKLEDYEQAILAMKEYISIKEDLHGEHDPTNSGLYYKLGSIYFHLSRFEEAHKAFQKAFNLIKEVGPEEANKASYLYYFIGLTQYNLKQFEEAKANTEKALDHYEAIEDQKTVYRCGYLLGLICEELNDIDGAALYFKRALLAAEEAFSPESHEIAVVNYLIGKSEFRLDRVETAIKYTKKALEIFENLKEKDPIDVADTNYNLSLMYYKKKEVETSLKHLDEALDIYVVFKDKNDLKLAIVYENKAMALESLDRDSEALKAFDKAIAICDLHKDTTNLQVAKIYYNIARIYSEFWPEKLEAAKEYAKKALKIAESHKETVFYSEVKAFAAIVKEQS